MILHNENRTLSILLYPKDEDLISIKSYIDEKKNTYYQLYISHDVFAVSDQEDKIHDLMTDIKLALQSKRSFTIMEQPDGSFCCREKRIKDPLLLFIYGGNMNHQLYSLKRRNQLQKIKKGENRDKDKVIEILTKDNEEMINHIPNKQQKRLLSKEEFFRQKE